MAGSNPPGALGTGRHAGRLEARQLLKAIGGWDWPIGNLAIGGAAFAGFFARLGSQPGENYDRDRQNERSETVNRKPEAERGLVGYDFIRLGCDFIRHGRLTFTVAVRGSGNMCYK